jgi:hypothetical protein
VFRFTRGFVHGTLKDLGLGDDESHGRSLALVGIGGRYAATVTRVPMGVKGQMTFAASWVISTHPRLWGHP